MADSSAPAKPGDINLDPSAVRGTTGLVQYGGKIQEEWLRKLRGVQGIRAYQEMRDNSPVIGAVITWLESQLRAIEWRVVPAGEDELSKEAAEFLSSCMDDMENTWEEFVVEVLSMLWAGFSLFEETYKVRRGVQRRDGGRIDQRKSSRHRDGLVGWASISIRGQETIDAWDISDDGEILGAWQLHPLTGKRIYLPAERTLLFRTKATRNNPEGRSIFRNAYIPYMFAKNLQEVEAITCERDGTGLPDMQVPPQIMSSNATAEQAAIRDTLEEYLSELRNGERAFLLRPAEVDQNGQATGYKFSLLASPGSKSIDIGEVIRRHEKNALMSVLADHVVIGLDGVGSLALHDSKTSVAALPMRGYAQSIGATLNRHAIPRLFELNPCFPEECWPHLEPGDFETPDLGPLGSFLSAMVQSAIIQPDKKLERHVRAVAQLPDPDEDQEMAETPDVQRAMDAIANEVGGEPVTQPSTQPAPTVDTGKAPVVDTTTTLNDITLGIWRLLQQGDLATANILRRALALRLGVPYEGDVTAADVGADKAKVDQGGAPADAPSEPG